MEKVSKKVELLASSYQILSKENQSLIQEKESLLIQVDDLTKKIEGLKDNIEKISISSSFDDQQKDPMVARKKINMFLREIDRCITLLSN